MNNKPQSVVGFIGLGSMGEPMALNLARSGTPLIVWNRTLAKSELLETVGATVAASVEEVFAETESVILMLADSLATILWVYDREAEFPEFKRYALALKPSVDGPTNLFPDAMPPPA